MTGQEIIKRFNGLKQERANIDGTYDLIDRFIAPLKGRLYTRDEEGAVDWRNRDRYDDTAVLAAQTLASSVQGAVTNPATKWFKFRFKEERLNRQAEALRWLESAANIVYHTLLASNFHTEVSEFFLNDVAFGTVIMAHSSSFYFKTLDVKGAYFETDEFDKPIGLYFQKELTALQLVTSYPDTVPDQVKRQAATPGQEQTKHEVVYAIYYKPKNQVDLLTPVVASKRPFQEKIVLKQGGVILNKEPRGYYEFPAYLLRWGSVAGSKFGYSPGINSLSTVLTLNELVALSLRAAEKAIDPPMKTLDRGIVGDPDLRAGGRTNVRDMDAIQPLLSGARFDVAQLEYEKLVRLIRQAFYVDQLELKESPAMTATEVTVRYELMQRLIGPPVTRIKSDFLDPLLSRSFHILLRRGMIPKPPDIVSALRGEYEIEYLGSWTRSQQADEAAAIEGAIGSVAQLATIDPTALDGINITKAATALAIRKGLPAEYIRTDREVRQLQQQRAKQQQMAQQVELLARGSEAIKNFGVMNEQGNA